MPGAIASALLITLLSLGMNGCMQTQPPPVANACKDMQLPAWVNDPFVGVSRITASGNRNDQKKIALQRAIADLLMTRGKAEGRSVISLQRDLRVDDEDETLQRHFREDSIMDVTYEQLQYSIKVTDVWRDPCTQELYVKIKEN